MRTPIAVASTLACLLLSATTTSAQDPPSGVSSDKAQKSTEERLSDIEKKLGGDTMRAFWKEGLRFESVEGRYKFRIGGILQYDLAFFDPDDDTRVAIETGTTRIEDGSEFRRARIELSGEADGVEFNTTYDFALGKPSFKNLYVGLKDLFFGNLRVGQMKEPFGLEQITSATSITFLERSLTSAAEPARNAGIMAWDTAAGERMSWAVGAFRAGLDDGEVSKGDGEWAETARVTGLPFFSEDGTRYVHLGLSLTHREATDELVSFAAKPEADLAPAYIDIVNLPADSVDALRPELAWVHGPFSLQGEYTWAQIDSPAGAGSDVDFTGWYAQASWLLTGEHRPYKKASGCFDKVRPQENAFSPQGGRGAWELAARYSTVDFSDSNDGELDDITLGVNWYLNPNTRVMMNYVLAQLDPPAGAPEGDTGILEFRVQFVF